MEEKNVSINWVMPETEQEKPYTIDTFMAELIGTSGLTFLACGVAVLSGTDMVATSLAFGLVIIAMAFSIGNISQCHLNPAVSLSVLVNGKMKCAHFWLYILAQVLGAFLGSVLLGLCHRGDFNSLASNSIQTALKNAEGELDAWSYVGAILVEFLMTFVLCLVVMGVSDGRKYKGNHGGIIIGITLSLLIAVGLRLTGTSVNPARSLAPASIEAMDGNVEAIKQIWIFLIFPLAGGALAGWVYGLMAQ